uniref:Bromo domain-containing protein n=1 Tax=Phaeomonas parva TaxID=124430 RepID=A0A7S1TWM5_9STRA|mmetsp:Transcript_21233/g.64667  ORF Transcript_21233/g.64667 Transcript_21233/m.64667 type:complete len:226 (+) Transcript_21233:276-953(+)
MAKAAAGWPKAMASVLDFLDKQQEAYIFAEPVDWKGMGLFDYPQIIKHPMDLGTVRQKLNNKEYRTASECAEDIRLVWRNCMTYNQDGSDFYKIAERFSKKFETKFAPVAKAEARESVEDERPPTTDERIVFSHNLFNIRMQELGQLIQKLDGLCPECLEKKPDEDEIEINVDAIDAATFRNVDRFVKDCLPDASGKAGGNAPSTKKRKANAASSAKPAPKKAKH